MIKEKLANEKELKISSNNQIKNELNAVENIDESIDDEDVEVPLTFAMFIFVGYLLICALIFSKTEGWKFLQSIYFSFITFGTIGK